MKVALLNIWILLALNAFGQKTEAYLQNAKASAKAGNYLASHGSIDSLLAITPIHKDGLIYKANLYSWDKKNDSALITISKIPEFETDIEANYLKAVYLFRSQRLVEALMQCQRSLSLKSNYLDAQLLELDILVAMKNYKEAFEKSHPLKDISTKAKQINRLAANKYLNTRVTVGLTSTFQSENIQHRYMVQGQISKNKFTSISSICYVVHNASSQIQFTEEVYRTWKKYGYSYGSVSYSKSTLFPLLSLAAVHFIPVHKTIEADLGVRYYQGQNKQKTIVPSIGAAYTLQKMAFHYRYYKVLGSRTEGTTHTLSLRRFLNQPEDYVRMDMSLGNQFDLYNRANTEYSLNTKGYSIGAAIHKSINSRIQSTVGVLYTNSTINESITRSTINTTFNLTYKFRSL